MSDIRCENVCPRYKGGKCSEDGKEVSAGDKCHARNTVEIQYQEVSVKRVIDYYVEAFREPNGKIQCYESFIDTAKGKIILQLFIEKGGE